MKGGVEFIFQKKENTTPHDFLNTFHARAGATRRNPAAIGLDRPAAG
jgi:hypothetical protein